MWEHDQSSLHRLHARLALLGERLPGHQRLAGGLEHGVMAAVAALMAYLPTRAFGLHEGFWAAITAIAVVQTQFGATRNTARDQFTGAAIGGLIGGVMASAAGDPLWAYALAVVIAILACWLANVASAARLAGTTATIILLVPHTGSALSMVVARVSEVGLGVTVALAVVWTGTWLGQVWQNRTAITGDSFRHDGDAEIGPLPAPRLGPEEREHDGAAHRQ